MWVHESCGGKVDIYLSADEGLTWECEGCQGNGHGDRDLRSLPNEPARQQYIKDLKDKVLTEKIKKWALEGIEIESN